MFSTTIFEGLKTEIVGKVAGEGGVGVWRKIESYWFLKFKGLGYFL